MDPVEEYHSPYTYVGNNPILAFDPNGLDTYIFLYGEPGLGQHNAGPNTFKFAAMTRLKEVYPQMTKDDQFVILDVHTVEDINSTLSKFDDIALFEMFGHGSTGKFYVGENTGGETNLTNVAVPFLGGKFVEGGKINVNSCYGAAGGDQSLTKAFAERYGVSATGSTTGMTFERGEVQKNGFQETHMKGSMKTHEP